MMVCYLLQAVWEGKTVIHSISDDTDIFVLLIFWVLRLHITALMQMEKWDGSILHINDTAAVLRNKSLQSTWNARSYRVRHSVISLQQRKPHCPQQTSRRRLHRVMHHPWKEGTYTRRFAEDGPEILCCSVWTGKMHQHECCTQVDCSCFVSGLSCRMSCHCEGSSEECQNLMVRNGEDVAADAMKTAPVIWESWIASLTHSSILLNIRLPLSV